MFWRGRRGAGAGARAGGGVGGAALQPSGEGSSPSLPSAGSMRRVLPLRVSGLLKERGGNLPSLLQSLTAPNDKDTL